MFVIVGSVLFGVGVAWFLPNLMIMVAGRVAPEQQGRAAGLVKGANYLGSPTAVFLAEPIARTHGAAGAIVAAAALSLSLFVLGLGQLWRGRNR
jgi:predicted MFS family arabinose efflux permease